MKFIQSISDSIYSPTFYQKVLKEPFKNSLKYLLLLSVFLAFIHTLDALPSLMNVQRQAPIWVNDLVNYVPAELQVKIENGQAISNVPEPYFLPLDPNNPLDASASGQHLMVIDTKTPFSANQFKEYQAVAWLTKDTLFYQGQDNQELKTFDLSKVQNITVDRNLVRQMTNYLNPWYNFLAPILFVVLFLGITVAYLSNMLYVVLLAALIWLVAKLLKHNFTYSQSYKVGIHAITLGLILNLITTIASRWVNTGNMPFMFTILAMAVVAVNLFVGVRTKNASA